MTTPPNANALPKGTRIGRTALRVSDLEEQTEFYRDVVGLRVLRRSEAGALLGAGERPLLVLERDGDAPERRRSEAGLYHNAFDVPSRAALGDALGRIRDRWRLEGASDHRVSEALYLTDPEGNGVEIYRDYPREEWPVADDGRVQMATDPLDLSRLEAAAAGETHVPPGTGVGHVHLEVSSLDAFEEFYVDALGFEPQTSASGALFVSAGGYHHHLGANTWHGRTKPVAGRGLSWFEVLVPDRGTLEAVRGRLADRKESIAETDGGFAVVDPDGNEIRVRTAQPDR
ncbi:VOC family protein [Natronococcus sp. JC468]|uniref:VOC family protein n=1 Tax=Natronococcus sp. JC468 TaxID=1961921 RepID=UPI00143A9F45|nr:VOC family protein [Natronococcus sp. JC468]NKE37384.1 VOC family protein [Natronococcus sp. JC468]